MRNVLCTCIIRFCKFYQVVKYAEPRFVIGHLLRHDEEELKEIAISLDLVGPDTTLSKEAIARRLFSFCRVTQ